MLWSGLNTGREDKLIDAVNRGEIKRILLVRCQKIGDMLTFLPTVLGVRRLFPHARISLLCRRDGLDVAKRVPFLSILLAEDLDVKSLRRTEPFDLLITSSQDAAWIKIKKKLNITFAVGVLPDSLRGVCLKHLWMYRYFTCTDRYTYKDHDVERNLKLLKLLGLNRDKAHERSLWLSKSEQDSALLFVHDTSAPLVVIVPSGSRPSKNWPADKFASLCEQLTEKRGARILIVGKGDLAEKQALDICALTSASVQSIVNKTSFGELSAIINNADLLISVDSGPAHIASYLNRPLIVLFGPGDFEQWKPWHTDESNGVAIRAFCKCGTTLHKCLEAIHCLESILPEDVFKAAIRLLDRTVNNRKELHE
jgi:ADP-heptose:LPS heptosyltransferase